LADLHYLELLELSRRIRAREISAVEATQAQFVRIRRLDPTLGSYVRLMPEQALDEARRADAEVAAGRHRGPLHGVPLALKDLCWTKGVPTAAGTTIYGDFTPDEDGTVVRRLREAGAVILGKTTLTEGAFADHHPSARAPVNPWSAAHWTGVSSHGSAIATAAGLCYGSLGSDTGGSIRFPVAANGCTGLKPTWGRVSRHGAFALAPTLDHIGPITRSAADAGAMLGAMAGPDPNDPTASHEPVPDYVAGMTRGLRGLRIGIDPRLNGEGIDEPTRQTVSNAQKTIADLGGDIREVRFPDPAQVLADFVPLCGIEAAVVHEATYPSRKDEYGPTLAAHIERGRALSALDYEHIILRRQAFTGRMHALFQDIDLLLVPASGIAAATLDQMAALADDPELFAALLRFSSPFNMSGTPTLTLPGGVSAHGTPIAFQLVAGHFEEQLLISAGWAYQLATDWHRKHPVP